MSVDAGHVVSDLDRYLDRVLPISGALYVLGPDEVYLAGDDLHWRHGKRIRLRDERAEDVARTIQRFVPALGGGPVGWVLDATVRGKITRSPDAGAVAFLSEIEEVDLRDDWLTARMRLRDVR